MALAENSEMDSEGCSTNSDGERGERGSDPLHSGASVPDKTGMGAGPESLGPGPDRIACFIASKFGLNPVVEPSKGRYWIIRLRVADAIQWIKQVFPDSVIEVAAWWESGSTRPDYRQEYPK